MSVTGTLAIAALALWMGVLAVEVLVVSGITVLGDSVAGATAAVLGVELV